MVPTAVADDSPNREDDIEVIDTLEEVNDSAAALQVAKQLWVPRIVRSRARTVRAEGRVFEARWDAFIDREEKRSVGALKGCLSADDDL